MNFNVLALLALFATAAWAGACLLANIPFTILEEPVVDRQLLETISIVVVPLLVIWLAALFSMLKGSSERGLSNLQTQLINQKSLLKSYNESVGNLTGLNGTDSWQNEAVIPESPTEPAIPTDNAPQNPVLTQAEPLPVSCDVLVRALNFAEHESDTEAIEAMNAAARDPEIQQLLNATMLLLQSLANAGLAVETMPTDYTGPLEWRKHLAGNTNNQLDHLGSIGTVTDHATVRELLGSQPDLRKVADEFTTKALTLSRRFMSNANDNQIMAFANTRTIRTWILIHYVTPSQ